MLLIYTFHESGYSLSGAEGPHRSSAIKTIAKLSEYYGDGSFPKKAHRHQTGDSNQLEVKLILNLMHPINVTRRISLPKLTCELKYFCYVI